MKNTDREASIRFRKMKNWLKRNKNSAPSTDAFTLALHLCFDECCQFEDDKVVVMVKTSRISPEEVQHLLKGCKQLGFKAEW